MTDFLKPVVTTGDEFVIAVMTQPQADWLAKFLWRFPSGIHHDYLDQLAGIFDLKEFGDRLHLAALTDQMNETDRGGEAP